MKPMHITIWHNPRCSKSRAALAYLESKGLPITTRLYLEDAPSADELAVVLKLLNISPRHLMRTSEAAYKDQHLADVEDPAALINAMANTPKLIERPVIIINHGDTSQATIARPLENLTALI